MTESSSLFLTSPDRKYHQSFVRCVLDYQQAGELHCFKRYQKALTDFEGFLSDLANAALGIGLPPEDPPVSSFWLIDAGEVVGVTRVRHRDVLCDGHIGYDISPSHRKQGYGTVILRLALKKAAEFGIREAYITCSIHNPASRKIIEKNHGQLLGTVYDPDDRDTLYRFKIDTAN